MAPNCGHEYSTLQVSLRKGENERSGANDAKKKKEKKKKKRSPARNADLTESVQQ